jgi:hypothetical protein
MVAVVVAVQVRWELHNQVAQAVKAELALPQLLLVHP